MFGYRLNDITRATNAKSEVEQKQREEAKDRKLTNGEWETKVSFELSWLKSFNFVSLNYSTLNRSAKTGSTRIHLPHDKLQRTMKTATNKLIPHPIYQSKCNHTHTHT